MRGVAGQGAWAAGVRGARVCGGVPRGGRPPTRCTRKILGSPSLPTYDPTGPAQTKSTARPGRPCTASVCRVRHAVPGTATHHAPLQPPLPHKHPQPRARATPTGATMQHPRHTSFPRAHRYTPSLSPTGRVHASDRRRQQTVGQPLGAAARMGNRVQGGGSRRGRGAKGGRAQGPVPLACGGGGGGGAGGRVRGQWGGRGTRAPQQHGPGRPGATSSMPERGCMHT